MEHSSLFCFSGMSSFQWEVHTAAYETAFCDNFERCDLFTLLNSIPFTLNQGRIDIFKNILASLGGRPSKLLVMYNEMYNGESPQHRLHPRPSSLQKKKPYVQLYYHVLRYCNLYDTVPDPALTQWAEDVSQSFDMFEKKQTYNNDRNRLEQHRKSVYRYFRAIEQFPHRGIFCNHADLRMSSEESSDQDSVDWCGLEQTCPLRYQKCVCGHVIHEKCFYMRTDGYYFIVGNDCVRRSSRTSHLKHPIPRAIQMWRRNITFVTKCPIWIVTEMMDRQLITKDEGHFLRSFRKEFLSTPYTEYHLTRLRVIIYNSYVLGADLTPNVQSRLQELEPHLPKCGECKTSCLQFIGYPINPYICAPCKESQKLQLQLQKQVAEEKIQHKLKRKYEKETPEEKEKFRQQSYNFLVSIGKIDPNGNTHDPYWNKYINP